MRLFQGKKEAEKILSDLKKKIKKAKLKPGLAVILVDGDRASRLYVELKKGVAKRVGIRFILRRFSPGAGQERIIKEIKNLNRDKKIHGILVQLPLPRGYCTSKIIGAVDPKKDVDRGVLASVIYFALKKGIRETKQKEIVAVVNSHFFGKALEKFFLQKGIRINYLLRKDFSPRRIKSADAIITICGCPRLIKGDMIKDGAVLIDAGIPADVDRESVEKKAAFLTPVPGGLGPLTVALLLKKVYQKAYGSCQNH